MRKVTPGTSHNQALIPAALFFVLAIVSADARAQKTEEEIALAAQNPVAAMISVPFQYNYDQRIGPQQDGHKNYVNVQPVIPISLNEDWNLISRTILPVVWQNNIFPGAGNQSGIGDVTQSFFFSPKKPTAGGWIWGAGPVAYLPTASNNMLGADKWGLGLTGVMLRQENGWTYGVLANHIWSVGGWGSTNISSTFLQPFVTYTMKTHTSFTANSESTYDWNRKNWTVPINLMVSQLVKFGGQRLQLQAGVRYWATSPDGAAHGWGARVTVTFLFPH